MAKSHAVHAGRRAMTGLLWVNADSTVLVQRFDGPAWSCVFVATRPDSDALWGPPIKCEPDAETRKVLEVTHLAVAEVERSMEQDN